MEVTCGYKLSHQLWQSLNFPVNSLATHLIAYSTDQNINTVYTAQIQHSRCLQKLL